MTFPPFRASAIVFLVARSRFAALARCFRLDIRIIETNDARRIFRATRALIRPAVFDIALGEAGDLFPRGGER